MNMIRTSKAETGKGLKSLAYGFLIRLAKDWDAEHEREKICAFMETDMFVTWCRILDIRPSVVREKLLRGTYNQDAVRRPKKYRTKGGESVGYH